MPTWFPEIRRYIAKRLLMHDAAHALNQSSNLCALCSCNSVIAGGIIGGSSYLQSSDERWVEALLCDHQSSAAN